MSWGDSFGLGWPVVQQGGALLASSGDVAAARFTSASAETIDAVWLYLDRTVAGGVYRLDIFENGSLPQSGGTTTFRPNGDVSVGSWEDEGGATTSIFESIDEMTLDDTDYAAAAVSPVSTYEFRVDAGSFSLPAGVDVLEVRLRAVVTCHVNNPQTVTVGVDGVEASSVVAMDDGRVTVEVATAVDGSGDPWDETSVQALDDARTLTVESAGVRVLQAWVEVDTASPADVQSSEVQVDDDGWVEFPVSWSKADTTGYTMVLVKKSGPGRAVWPTLDSGESCPHVGWGTVDLTVDSLGLVTTVGESSTAAHPVVLEDGTGSASDDSQPYAALTREPVYTGRTVVQEVTGSALTAGWVEAVVARHPNCTEDLTVTLSKRSDDSTVGVWTLEADEVTSSPRKLDVRSGLLDPGGAVDTSQHYLTFASGADEGTSWEVATLDTNDPPLSAETVGFGGTTDVATIAGTDDADVDVPVVVKASPTAPAGFTATGGTTDGFPTVDLAWTATSLSGDFSHYLILRDGVALAKITAEAVTTFTDSGPRPGVEETYAIQVHNSDGAGSSLAEDTATAGTPTGTHWFTSLHDPTLDLTVRGTVSGGIGYEFAEERTLRALMGRDNHVLHRSTVDRGDRFTVVPLLDDGQDRALFDDLLALRSAKVPHVTVTSRWGRRWLAAVLVDEGQLRSIVTLGQAPVQVVEVADRPTVVEVST